MTPNFIRSLKYGLFEVSLARWGYCGPCGSEATRWLWPTAIAELVCVIVGMVVAKYFSRGFPLASTMDQSHSPPGSTSSASKALNAVVADGAADDLMW